MQVLFGRHVDVGALDSAMENVRQTEMTPKLFTHNIYRICQVQGCYSPYPDPDIRLLRALVTLSSPRNAKVNPTWSCLNTTAL